LQLMEWNRPRRPAHDQEELSAAAAALFLKKFFGTTQ